MILVNYLRRNGQKLKLINIVNYLVVLWNDSIKLRRINIGNLIKLNVQLQKNILIGEKCR